MRSLTYVSPGLVEWREVPDPALRGDQEAIVRPVAASTCDLDQQIVRGKTPLPGPFAIGHECLAEIVELGDAVVGLTPGQVVVVAWHISCGQCARCRAGLTCHCEAVPRAAMFGVPVGGDWGGLFDDFVRIPYARAMLFPVPTDVGWASLVSASDNQTLAIEALDRHLAQRPGGRVLVLGARSSGLYAVDGAQALGASEIVYADTRPARLDLARELGARAVNQMPDADLGEFDVIVDARLNPEWLRAALLLLSPEGVCETVGPYFQDASFPLFEMYVYGARYRINRGNVGAHIPRLLDLVAANRLRAERIVSETLDWEAAPEALIDPSLKPMFVRAPESF